MIPSEREQITLFAKGLPARDYVRELARQVDVLERKINDTDQTKGTPEWRRRWEEIMCLLAETLTDNT